MNNEERKLKDVFFSSRNKLVAAKASAIWKLSWKGGRRVAASCDPWPATRRGGRTTSKQPSCHFSTNSPLSGRQTATKFTYWITQDTVQCLAVYPTVNRDEWKYSRFKLTLTKIDSRSVLKSTPDTINVANTTRNSTLN